jgi:hypothetical protein
MRILINTNNRNILRVFLLTVVLLIFLSNIAETLHAASFSVGATGSGYPPTYCANKPPGYNRLAGDGLVLAASDACTWDYTGGSPGYTYTYSGASSAGAYGTDTSLSAIMLAALEGVSVEPMADAMAQANCSGACSSPRSSHASAAVSIAHKFGERLSNPLPPETPNYIQILNNIPVVLRYKISASIDGPSGSVYAGFGILGCNTNFNRQYNAPTEYDGNWQGIVPIGCVMTISASASADAAVIGTSGTEAHATVDPFLQIDPTWEYAQHFIVEQGSSLVPGEWREVTRDWMYFCECDLEPDGDVDGMNLYAFMSDFGRTDCSGGCPGDLDGDGKVDDADLVLFAGDFGKVNCK